MRHGGKVRTGAAVRGIARRDDGVVLTLDGKDERFDAVIVAVAPHQLATALGAAAERDAAWRTSSTEVAALT